jgi:hypothetical protein
MRRTTSLFMGMPKAKVICCAMRGHPVAGEFLIMGCKHAERSRVPRSNLGYLTPAAFKAKHLADVDGGAGRRWRLTLTGRTKNYKPARSAHLEPSKERTKSSVVSTDVGFIEK